MARATSSSASRLNTSTTSSGTPDTRSSTKESLSDKLSGGRSARRSTRKRLSMTSETSHSTAASSNAMPLNDDTYATPISPQQPFDRKKKSRRRRSSVDRKERRHRSRSSSANEEADRKSKPERNKSFSSDSVTNFEEEASFREATSGFRSSSTAAGEASDGFSTPGADSKSSGRRRASSRALGSSSSRRTPSNGRGRTRRSSTATSPKRSSTATPRKESLATSSSRDSHTTPKSRKRESKSKQRSSHRSASASKSTRKNIRRSSSHEEQSLTSFMKKELSHRPEEAEDALEVKSAYTNLYSRGRKQRDDDWGLGGSSYHGESARRNTRSFRDEMAARAAALQNSSNEAEKDKGSPYRSRSFSAELQGGGTSSSGSNFRRSLSEDYQQQQGGMTSHPSFTSLPVLKEERKKDKKSSSSSKTKKSSRKSHRKRDSSRELGGFLKKKEEDAAKVSAPLSPVSTSRSVVSMPALHSPTASARQRKLSKFSSPGFAKPEPSPLDTQSEHHNAPPKRGKSSGNLLEQLGSNKERRARSSSKRRSRQRKSNGSRASLTTGLDRSMQDESTSSEVRRRSKSAHKALKMGSKHGHNKEGGERPRSLSRNRRVSQARSPPRHNNHKSGATRERKPPGRGRGLQKIFSIRDMRAEIEAGQQQQSKPLVFSREDASSEWGGLRTPSNSQRLAHSLAANTVPESPLPPLTPHSPIRSDRTGTRSTDEEDSSFYSYSGRDRRSSAPLGHRSSGEDYLPKRPSTQIPSMPASILKNRDEEIHQHSNGDREEEEEELGDQAFDFSLDYKDSLDYNEADLGIEEDVFTHYTWAFNDNMDTTPADVRKDLAKEERMFLKESIRESLLARELQALEIQRSTH